MKHSKQTRITAALFAAAISTAVGGNPASAAFSPEDQQIAAVLYGPPPVMDKVGDLDKNNILDARDVTLMKRELMFSRDDADVMQLRHLAFGQADYSGVKDFNNDQKFSKADVRAMLNRMTDAELPTTFNLFVYPVAYDPAEAEKLSRDEKMKRVYELDQQLIVPYSVTVKTDSSEWMEKDYVSLMPGGPVQIRLDHFAELPNNTGVVRKALITFERAWEDTAAEKETTLPDRFAFEYSYQTCSADEQGNITFFDKGIVEYNMTTGTCISGAQFEPRQDIKDPEYTVEQLDLLAEAFDREHPEYDLTEPEEEPEEEP